MKKLIVFSIIVTSTLLIVSGCDNSTPPQNIIKYPANKGNQWEYHTTWEIEYYDQHGKIDSTETLDMGNTIVKIASTNDFIPVSVSGMNNLIRFESFDSATPNNVQIIWYSNSDSGFYEIAYLNAGSSKPILPKYNTSAQLNLFLKELRAMMPSGLSSGNDTVNDSLRFFNPPRKVLQYPLQIGSQWTSMINPYKQVRSVNEKRILKVDAGTFDCYLVNSEGDFPFKNGKIVFNDYVNLNYGLLERYFSQDSMKIISEGGKILGYFKYTTQSELISKNF